MTKFYYRYTAGCYGTDVHGTLDVESIDEVYDNLEAEVYRYAEEMSEGCTTDDEVEWESDLFVTEYIAKEHEALVS